MKTVHTNEAPAAVGPYSQAITAGDMVFLSGQIALDPATGKLVGETQRNRQSRSAKTLRRF